MLTVSRGHFFIKIVHNFLSIFDRLFYFYYFVWNFYKTWLIFNIFVRVFGFIIQNRYDIIKLSRCLIIFRRKL